MKENLAIGISIIFLHQVPKSGIKRQHLHPQGIKKKRKKTHTHRYSLIFSGEKVALIDKTCFCRTNVGSSVHFALLYTPKCDTYEGIHTKSSEHFLYPCCELSLQKTLLQNPRQNLQKLRLHSRVSLIGTEGEESPVSIRV